VGDRSRGRFATPADSTRVFNCSPTAGVTRVGNLIDATEHIADVLARVKPQYLTRAYKLKTWDGVDDFLEQVARICGASPPLSLSLSGLSLSRAYKLKTWDGVDDFLEQVARICVASPPLSLSLSRGW
jgi:hypothetical protein